MDSSANSIPAEPPPAAVEGITGLLVAVAVLILLSMIFSASESAFLSINKLRIRFLRIKKDKRAVRAGKLLDRKEQLLNTVLVGNNIVNIAITALLTSLALQLFGQAGVGIATIGATILLLIFGEITPKTVGTRHPEPVAFLFTGIISFFMKLLSPLVFLFTCFSRGTARLFGIQLKDNSVSFTEDEIKNFIDVGEEEGVLESNEKNMMHRVFKFTDLAAKDIMIPRVDVTFIQVDATYNELLEIFREDMFTRFPVYEESTDDVIGVINMKDVLLYDHQTPFSIRNYLREVHFTYEHSSTLELLQEMRETSSNVTIVLDEYGATVGMITLEDLLEEIVGEIRDEYDENEIEAFQKTGENQYNIEASMKLDDINEILELNIHSDDYDSLGGFIIELLDRLPKEGEEVSYRNMTFKVLQVEKNRIDRIQLTIHPEFDIPEDRTSEAEN